MKVIISPAKAMDFERTLPTVEYSQPQNLTQVKTLTKELRKLTPQEIGKLLSISSKLSELNYKRFQTLHTPFNPENARPAVYAYAGDTYVGLDVFSLPIQKINSLQENVRILSGLYGLLRPLDLIQAYRLEMGTQLSVGDKKNLYDFWGTTLTNDLNRILKKGEPLVNLASNEYSKAIQFSSLKGTVINPIFKDFKNGTLKIISFYAKKARGMMTRFIIDHEVQNYEGLLAFNSDGYAFSEAETKDSLHPVFTR